MENTKNKPDSLNSASQSTPGTPEHKVETSHPKPAQGSVSGNTGSSKPSISPVRSAEAPKAEREVPTRALSAVSEPRADKAEGSSSNENEGNDWMGDMVTQAADAEKVVRGWITSRPVVAIAAAVGVGLATSLIMKRIARSSSEVSLPVSKPRSKRVAS